MKMDKKRVLVFGSGVSGISAADLLAAQGARVLLYDGNGNQEPEQILAKLKKPEAVEVILGELPEEALKGLDRNILKAESLKPRGAHGSAGSPAA